MRRLLNLTTVLVLPVLLGGCATDCFEWRCPLEAQSLAKYESFIKAQDVTTLDFAGREYRYRLLHWIGEERFAAAKQDNTKDGYDRFLAYYHSVQEEAGASLAVYADIAEARSSGTVTPGDEPKPIFSKDEFLPQMPPIALAKTDAQALIAANRLISTAQAPSPEAVTPVAAPPSFARPTDSTLTRSITRFVSDPATTDASEKDLKALIEAAAAQGDFGTAFTGLMNFANREDPHAQYLVGRMLEDGVGVDQNYQGAIDWFEKSANQQWDEAKAALLEMYEVGLGTPTDSRGRVGWHLRAAKLGHPAAQTRVGIIFENGDGVKKDLNEAARWYQRAAIQGDANAQFLLGWMYAEGQGVELDYIEAYAWFYLASSQGIAEADRLMALVRGEMSVGQALSAQQRADQRASKLRG
ncbi:MAG: sel1 repeat family protein [Rhodospirillales bacterium]|nr:sel1 repeat family protein [Rhodospirillales bacterium]